MALLCSTNKCFAAVVFKKKTTKIPPILVWFVFFCCNGVIALFWLKAQYFCTDTLKLKPTPKSGILQNTEQNKTKLLKVETGISVI